MVKKDLAFKGLILTLLSINAIHAIQPGDTVAIPEWWKQVDLIIGALDGISDKFAESKDLYAQWASDLNPLASDLEHRQKERAVLYDCIRRAYEAKLAEINSLNENIEHRNTIIFELEEHVAFLELEINRLNQTIEAKKQEIADTTDAYNLVLGENAEQAERLLSVINGLTEEYDMLTQERNKFRNILESFYNKLQNYTAEVRTDALSVAHDICNPEFIFNS